MVVRICYILSLICVLALGQVGAFPKVESNLSPISSERNSKESGDGQIISNDPIKELQTYDVAPKTYLNAFNMFWNHKKTTQRLKRGSTTSTPSKCKCNCSLASPVCGRGPDGKLEDFPSQCAMECYECTHNKKYILFRRGSCPAVTSVRPTFKPFTPVVRPTTRRPSPPPQCKCNCPRGKVLCAQDKHGNQETFGSDCALICFNCTHNSDYRKIKDGDCDGRH